MNIYKALYLSMVRMRRRDNASIGPVSHCEWCDNLKTERVEQ